jgi:hypothetical protein
MIKKGRIGLIQKVSLVGLLAFLIAGCATPTNPKKSYNGTTLPEEQITRIAVEVKERSLGDALLLKKRSRIYITHVDDQPLGDRWSWSAGGSMFKSVVDLLPGEHSITVAFTIEGGSALEVYSQTTAAHQAAVGKVLKLNAQAGRKYIVRYIENRLPLICWVEDEATGDVVSGDKPPEAKNVN